MAIVLRQQKNSEIEWAELDNNFAELDARVAALQLASSFVSYQTVWACDGSIQPSIGNGSISSRYIQNGKLCTVQIEINYGSTTVTGNGNWRFSIPKLGNGQAVGSALFLINSVWNYSGTVSGVAENQYVEIVNNITGYFIPFDITTDSTSKFIATFCYAVN